MKFSMFFLLVAVTLVAAYPGSVEEEQDAAPAGAQCSAWLGYCQQTSDCCRHLICSSYQAKCVPKQGIRDPADKRPVGDGPYPPGFQPH